MNKTVLKNFAINARLELLARVRDRAALYGITDEKVKNQLIVSSNGFQKIDGQLLSKNEIAQRNALLQRIQNNGFVQVMEEVAYTWFNRFIAIKYMEVHKLLPIDQRVIPQQAGELPQIVREAQNVSLENIDFDTVAQYLDANRTEELYKYLVIALCNQLSGCLPQMFETISDYTELLFPDGLMKADSFLGMVANVGDESWEEIQVIGWLYQYYNTDLKNETFDLLKKNVKITKDRIGAATQLFTPEWIVRYMVENSLGRLWYEGHPDDNLIARWLYYLDEAKQESEVEVQLAEIRKERKEIQPEEIKLIDPCMGSGHILVYAFDVLMDIYRSVGYTDRDAVQSITQNNIYGLDIDDRAAQLAYFALMMKATEYDKRFLKRMIQPNVCAIQESNSLVEFSQLKGQMSLDTICLNTANQLISAFIDAKEYGSILTPHIDNLSTVDSLIEQLKNAATKNLEVSAWYEQAKGLLPQLAKQAIILQQLYDVAVTNPPYMGSSGMGERLSQFVKELYPDSKSDLFSVFMERTFALLKPDGFEAMITMESWMFLSSFENLRTILCQDKTINCMVHMPYLGKGGTSLGINFGTEMAVIQNTQLPKYTGVYDRVSYYETDEDGVPFEFPTKNEFYKCFTQSDFIKLPGKPIAYWLNEFIVDAFYRGEHLDKYIDARIGMVSGDNDRFLRYWHEVNMPDIEFNARPGNDPRMKRWYPLQKGGEYRHWYGNLEYVIDWENDGDRLKNDNYSGNRVRSHNYNGTQQFKEGITWNSITSSKFQCRYSPEGFTFDASGPLCEVKDPQYLWYILGMLSSKVADYLFSAINPTVNFPSGYLGMLPLIIEEKETIDSLVKECITISHNDWDSFETSWDFIEHPLVYCAKSVEPTLLSDAYASWKQITDNRYNNLKHHEETMNEIFIKAYHLNKELHPEIQDKEVTVNKAEKHRDICSLISYAVGCMFGRYSLDIPGLVYAGGDWDSSKYVTYPADRDGILPITDDEYFQDDIVSMFVRWVKTVYGEETLEENLQFIANALNPNGGTSREVIRSYFLNDFYADHLKIYQKRPIYWQFDSGKQNGFKALMYLHRYDQDTVARLRTDYVHELQDRYRTQLEDARKTADSGDARQRSAANKRAQKLDKQLTELNKYEELVHHYADMRIPLDLDDGVKVNYAKLQDILTRIK